MTNPTPTQPTPEQLARARRIAASQAETQSQVRADILAGQCDGWHGVRCALTAILAADQQQAELMRHAEAMAGATAALEQFFVRPEENSIDKFDRLAEQYRRETGMWAPGKSIPDAYNDTTEPEERMAAYDAWVTQKIADARQALTAFREYQGGNRG